MNKNIKRIIAITVAVNTISTISPTTLNTYFVGAKPVYASSYSPDDEQLKTLKIKSLDGETLDLRDGYNGDTVKLSDETEYYTKLTDDSDGIKITADAEGDDYVVKIFTSDAENATAYDPGDEILLGKGDTTLYIRTYESKSAFNKVKNNVSNCEEEYTLNVRKTTESSYEDDSQDPIYLDNIDLSKGDIDFIKGKTSYDIKVDENVDSMWIKAIPENNSDRVRVDGSLVDSSDNYKETVSLDKGKNEIKIKVTDSKDNQRTYTLNVTRGDDSDNEDDIYLDHITLSEGDIDFSKDDNSYNVDLDESVSKITIGAEPEDSDYSVTIDGDEVRSSDDYEKKVSLDKGENVIKVNVEDELNDKKRTYTLTINRGKEADDSKDNNTEDTSDKKSQWVQTTDGWKYYDENGKVLKSSWLYDKDQKVYCYLDKDGLRVTGWHKDNEKWYLLDSKGAMLTGWQKDNEKWYLLGSDGAMLTGWHKETVDDQNKNTDAAANSADNNTKKVDNWYYLNQDGSMRTGWLSDGGKWYFFNADGTMQKGWLIDYNSKYYLTEDGSMATGTRTINGKEYKFNDSGALIL